MNEQRKCPKCGGEMVPADVTYALPQYVDQGPAHKNAARINPQSALPVEVFHCEGCRHVELVAG
jgi:hypothetical protein